MVGTAGAPDLSDFDSGTRGSIEATCTGAYYEGPVAHNKCLNEQVNQLVGESRQQLDALLGIESIRDEHEKSFILQVGAFKRAENARALQAKLEELEIGRVYLRQEHSLVRVYAGPFLNRVTAESASKAIRDKLSLRAQIAQYDARIHDQIDPIDTQTVASNLNDAQLCSEAIEIEFGETITDDRIVWNKNRLSLVNEAIKRGLDCIPEKNASRVRELEMELLALKAEKEAETLSISQDSRPPTLQIVGKYSEDATGFIEGRVTDNVGVVELLVNDQPIAFGNDGRFTYREYLPSGGKEFTLVAIDRAGLKTTETIRINRETPTQVAKISFDRLNPTTRRVESNNNAIALIVGVAEYSKTAPAEFADKDAQVFYDYANLKLGIPRERIQTLVNDKADVVGLLSGINKWLKRSVKQGESDVYIFFAGHGLASDDGDTAYLIPYDGAPDFLERTAISRDEVFREVSSVNPRSVTVFLDTCYSGDTRGETRLIAGRPLGIKLQEQSLPAGFTVLTAAGGDQIARPLTEAQHGMFSYFLMKGMEGDADSDGNNEITARELHSFVRENVVQQSGGSQVPELQGDGEKVLVRFQ